MTSTMKAAEPREFWLEKIEHEDSTELAVWDFRPPFEAEFASCKKDFIHVIEHSAYQHLRDENELLQSKLDSALKEVERWKKHYEAKNGVCEYVITENATLEATISRQGLAIEKLKEMLRESVEQTWVSVSSKGNPVAKDMAKHDFEQRISKIEQILTSSNEQERR